MPDEDGRSTWDEWFESLTAADRARASDLLAMMSAAGADDPQSWVRSEVTEGIAQGARFSFLRAVWRDLDRWRDEEFVDDFLDEPALAGCDRVALRQIAAQIAFQATLEVVMTIDDEEDVADEHGLPGWRLMEQDEDCELTGRAVVGLHESFLDVDPRGCEAEDIRGW